MSTDPSLEDLKDKWNHLYRTRLPSLAKAKDPVQPRWPVQLDHCFARIVLDNAVGKDRPWAQVVKSPAYKNMSRKQLEDAIDLGEKLANGAEDLVRLDERSLALRGKKSKLVRKAQPLAQKRKAEEGEDEALYGNSEGHDRGAGRPNKKSSRRKVTSPRCKNGS